MTLSPLVHTRLSVTLVVALDGARLLPASPRPNSELEHRYYFRGDEPRIHFSGERQALIRNATAQKGKGKGKARANGNGQQQQFNQNNQNSDQNGDNNSGNNDDGSIEVKVKITPNKNNNSGNNNNRNQSDNSNVSVLQSSSSSSPSESANSTESASAKAIQTGSSKSQRSMTEAIHISSAQFAQFKARLEFVAPPKKPNGDTNFGNTRVGGIESAGPPPHNETLLSTVVA
ncbi:hypothetical protein C8J57DRAFT_1232322 [Mycena rebaudengoi]|nr:hypothetical protein C8J57DRAFT_1232322 [Mycena rebaudengoi]